MVHPSHDVQHPEFSSEKMETSKDRKPTRLENKTCEASQPILKKAGMEHVSTENTNLGHRIEEKSTSSDSEIKEVAKKSLRQKRAGFASSKKEHINTFDMQVPEIDHKDDVSLRDFKVNAKLHQVEGKKLEKQSNELLTKFNACTTDDEKEKFYDTHKQEINQLEAKLKEYNGKLETIAGKFKTKDGELSSKDISVRYKSMKDPTKVKNASSEDTFQYTAFGLIADSYRSSTRALTDLHKYNEKEIFDLKFEDEKQCEEFAPFIKTIEQQALRLKGAAIDLTLKSKKNEKGDEIAATKDKLNDDVQKSVSDLKQACEHIRSQSEGGIPIKEMLLLLEKRNTGKRSLERSQTQILEHTQGAIRHIASAAESLSQLDSKNHLQLTEKTIKYELELKNKINELIIDGESNQSILKNKDVNSLKVKLTEVSNELLINSAKARAKYTEETFGIKSNKDLLENVKASPLYSDTKEAVIKNYLKTDLKEGLQKRIGQLANGKEKEGEIQALKNRIKELES
jgi:hypothetical protein